jgi:2-polyprenyl-3-methyl-5-hydroxy-6-metoxy-1,4-benzoquinol methylase
VTATDFSADFESTPCPLCGGGNYRVVIDSACDRLNRKVGVFKVQACLNCGLVATCPRPSARELEYFYQGTYSGQPTGRGRAWQTGFGARAAARYRLRAVERFGALSPGMRLLDVGCGYGAFASAARRRTGCAVTGIDMDERTLAHALDREQVDYRTGTLQTLGLAAAQFEVVTFFQSLEHHLDPVAALAQAYRLLEPGGLCVVEVPNFDGIWRRVFGSWWLPLLVPTHIVHFSPDTLRQAFERAGFEATSGHRAMFYPVESTASLALWLNERLGRPIRGFRLRWSRPDGAALLLALSAWWLLIELPAQALLVLAGRSGHQLMAGRKRD